MKSILSRAILLYSLIVMIAFSFLWLGCSSSSSNSSDDDVQADDDTTPADDDTTPADDDTTPAPTTLDVTFQVEETSPGSGQWQLVQAAGEPHLARNDLNVQPTIDPGDLKPLSVTYFATFADTHIADEESPARLTFFDSNLIFDGTFSSAYRPQEDLAGQMLNALVRTADRIQTDYNRDFDFALVLGDATDNAQTNEMEILVDVFDAAGLLAGQPGWVRVDSGDLDLDSHTGHDRGERNFGIQETNEQGQNIDPFNRPDYPNSNADFPTGGLVRASGQLVPWFYTVGNHDVENMGVFNPDTFLTFYKREDYLADRSPYGYLPGLANLVQYWKQNPQQSLHIGLGLLREDLDWRIALAAGDALGMIPANYTDEIDPNLELLRLLNNTPDLASDDGAACTPDAERAFIGREGVMQLLEPLGHGFTNHPNPDFAWYRLDWQQIDSTSDMPLRLLALDSTETETLSDGGVSEEQLNWLTTELEQAASDNVLVIVTSHYTISSIKKNGDKLDALLASYPNVMLFLEGHGHYNEVVPHLGTNGAAGYWEVQTPSDIQFPQQSRIFEIVDNRDGTGTVYVTLYDHWPIVGDDADTLSELGRQLAFEDELAAGWDGTGPFGGMGELSDRNVALTFAIPSAIADKLAQIPSDGSITSVDALGKLYHP